MADRYWVTGGTTTAWTDTSNWAATSGGTRGASAPTNTDNAYFDRAATYTVTGSANALNVLVSAGSVTFNLSIATFGGTGATFVTFNSGTVASFSTASGSGGLTLSTTTNMVVTTNGVVLALGNNALILGLSSRTGTITLGSNLTVTGGITSTSGKVQLNYGTLDLNNFSLTADGPFFTNNAVAHTLAFGTSGSITTSGVDSANTGFSLSGTVTVTGTPVVNIAYASSGTLTMNLLAATETNSISFNITAGSYALTVSAGFTFKNLNFTGFTGSWTPASACTFYGGLTLSSGMTFSSTASMTFAATSGSYTITTAGKTIDGGITWGVTASTATWQLQDNMTCATSNRTTNLTFGTLDLNGKTYTTSTFASNNSNTRALAFGVGKVVVNGNAVATVWNIPTLTGFTVSGTPLVECIGGGTGVTKIINHGAATEAQAISFSLLETTGTVTYTFASAATVPVKNLVVNGSQTVTNGNLTIYGAFTHTTTNGTTTFPAGTGIWTFAATSGTYNITPASSGFVYDFPWTFGSAATTATWVLQNIVTFGATRAITFVNGTLDANNYNFLGGVSIQINAGTFTLTNTGGSTFTTALFVSHNTGTFNLNTGFTTTTTNAAGYTFTAGTLSLGSNILNTPIFSSANANTRTIAFGTGKIVINTAVTSTVWNTSTITGLTVTGTPLVECKGGGTGVTKTISPGTLSEANAISFSLLETTGTATYTITSGTSNVKNLIVNGSQTLSNSNIGIYGTFTHTTTNGTTTFTAGTNAWIFAATSGSYSIGNIAGFTYDFPWTFGSAASTATWTLANNLTIGATRALTFTNGTLDFNNKTLTGANGITMVTGSFTLNNTGGTTFNANALPITHTSGTLTLGTNLTTTSTSGYTLTAGTLSLVTFTLTTPIFSSNNSNTRTINFGTGKIVLNGSATATIWNTSTVTGLTISGTPVVESIGGGTSVTKTITPGTLLEANTISFSLLETTGTATYTINGFVKNLIVNGSQTVGNLSSAITIFGTFTHTTTNGTTTFSGGVNTWQFAATSGSYTIGNIAGFTYDFPWTFGNAASTATWIMGANLTIGATRALTFQNGTLDWNNKTLTGANGIIMFVGSFTLNNTGGTTFNANALPITHTSGTLTLGTNLTTTSATGYTLTAGTLNLVTFTLTTPVFVSSNANARTLAFGSAGQIILTGSSATIFDITTATNFTSSGIPYIYCTYAGSVGTRTISTGFTETQANFGYDVYTTGGPSPSGIILTAAATDTIALTGSFRNLDFTGFAGTLSNTTRTIYGSWYIPAANAGTYTAGTAVTTFAASGTIFAFVSITTNGKTLDFPLTVNTVGGGLTLYDNLNNGTTRTLTLTTGTLNLNNFTLTTGFFSSSGAVARTLAFGSTGQLVLAGSGATIFDVTVATNFTTTGTPYLNCTYTGSVGTRTISTGFTEVQAAGYSFATSGTSGIVFSPTATDIIALTGSFYSINLTGFTGTLSNTTRTIYGSWTNPASGGTYTAGTLITTFGSTTSQTITTNNRTLDFPITFNGVAGSWALQTAFTAGSTRTITLTAGTLNLNNYTLTAPFFNTSSSSVRTLAFSTSGQLALNGTGTIFDATTATNYSTTGTVYVNASSVSGTKTIVTGFNETQANDGYSVATSGTSGIIINTADVITLTGGFFSINLTSFAGTLSNTTRTVYGNWVNPASGGTYTNGANITTFAATSSKTITSNGRTLDFPFAFNGVGGTWTLQDSLRLGSLNLITVTLTAGTLNLNNLTFTTARFNSSGTGVRTLAFGTSGQLALYDNNTTLFDITTATNFSTTGTVFINCTYAGAVGAKVFTTGFNETQAAAGYSVSTSGTSGIVLNSSATDTLTLTGSFYNINLAGFVGTLSNTARTIYGNWSNPATGGTYTAGAVATTFGATSSKTITTNGRTLDFALTFDGVGGTWVLQDNLTIGATRILTWNNGTLDLNNKTLSNPASITISGGVSGSFSLINTGGTSYTTSVAVTHTSGGFNVSIPSTFGTYAMNGGSITLNNTLNTSAFTWTAGTITLNSYQLTCTTFTSTSSTARTFAFGTGNLTVTGSGACFNMLGATNQVITGTPNVNITNATTTATSVVPGVVTEAQSLNFIFNSSSVSYTLTFLGTASHAVRDVTMTNFAGIWAAVSTGVIYGSFSGQSAGTITASASAITFAGTGLFGSKTVTTNGVSLAFPVNFNGIGSYWYTGNNFNCDATHAMTFTNGTLDGSSLYSPGVSASSLTMTTGTFTMNTMSFAVAFTHTSGTLTLTGSVFQLLGATVALSTYTLTAGTLNINCPMYIGLFSSANTNTRIVAFGSNSGGSYIGSIYIQYLITPVTSTSWNTAAALGVTTGWTTSGTPLIYINTVSGQTTTVATGIMTEAQSLSFTVVGNGTLTFLGTASYSARDVDLSGFTGTWSATAACTIYGSFGLGSSVTVTESTSIMTFAGTNAITKTLSFGVNIKFPMTFSSTATYTLQSNLVMGATAARALIITAGTFLVNNNIISAGFAGSAMSVNTGTITISNIQATLPFTLTSGTLTINDAIGGSYALINSNFTHTAGTLNISGLDLYVFDGNNQTTTYTYTFTAGTINLNNRFLQTSKFAATGATTRVIGFGTSGIIYINPLPGTTGNVWDQTTIGTFSYTGTSNIQVQLYQIPAPYTQVTTIVPGIATITNALNFTINSGGNSEPVSILGTASNTVRDLIFSGGPKWDNILGASCIVFGNFVLTSNHVESTNALTFGATTAIGTVNLDFSGANIRFPITLNGIGGNFLLTNSFYMGSTVARAITLVNGTLNMDGYVINLGFAGSTMSTNTNTVSIINAHNGIYLPFTITSGTCSIRGLSDNSYPAYFGSTFTFTAGTMTLNSNTTIVGAFTYTAGTINLSTYNLQLNTSYVASGATTRVINFGSGSYIQVNPTTTSTVWNAATIGTFSYTGTSDVRINGITFGNVYTISTGAATEAQAMNFTFTGDSYSLATNGSVFKNVYLSVYDDGVNFGTWTVGAITIYGNYTEIGATGYGDRYLRHATSASVITFGGASGSKTIDTRGIDFLQPVTFNGTCTWTFQSAFVTSGTNGTVTLTAGTIALNDYNLTCNAFNSSGSTARTINFGSTSPLVYNAIVCKGNGTSFTTATATSLVLAGSYPLIKIAPTAPAGTIVVASSGTEAQAFNFQFYNGDNGSNYTLSFLATAGYTAKNVDFSTGFTGTWAATSTGTIYGDLIISSGTITLTASASAMTFGATSGTKSINTNSVTIPFPITFNGVGGIWKLDSALSLTAATTHTNGTLNLNGYSFTTTTYATGAGTKSLLFNRGTLWISGSGATAFNNANPTNYTVGPGSTYGYILLSSASAKTFVGGGTNFDCFVANYGAGYASGTLTITGNNTFTMLGLATTILITGSNSFKSISVYDNAYPRTVTLTAGTTQTITQSGGWTTIGGTLGDLTTINSATAGTVANIARNYPVNDANYGGHTDYVSLKDINFLPFTNNGSGATPNIWWAGSHSTNLGNNFGVTFVDWNGTPNSSIKTYIIANTSITSWTTPTDWNAANNIVHLIGGGGGGGGSRYTSATNKAAGGGGGGGGYTKIINYSAIPSTSVSLSTGIAGTAGTTAGGTGGTGGRTLFDTYSANGGVGGSTTATPTSIGGAGGVGGTYNGGAGGNGAITTFQNYTGGGGGGGAAGPNGAGGNGGVGFANTGFSSTNIAAGGGGGGNGGGTAGANASQVSATITGGTGGNNSNGVGGGTGGIGAAPTGGAGTFGGGGGGGQGTIGPAGQGGLGLDILNTFGGGGGTGAGSSGVASVTALTTAYGAGGAGAGQANTTVTLAGGAGAQGLIVIQYYPIIRTSGTPSSNSNFFLLY